jgi:hypothetical protein
MAHGLLSIVALGALAYGATRLFGRRRPVAPTSAPELPRVQVAPLSTMRPPRSARPAQEAVTVQQAGGTPDEAQGYLLGGRYDSRHDTMAALLDTMSGPGLCTPRTHDPS